MKRRDAKPLVYVGHRNYRQNSGARFHKKSFLTEDKMDAFEQADAIVQVCGSIFGIAAVVLFVYFSFFRKKDGKK